MRVVKGCLFYLCTDKKKSVGTCEHVSMQHRRRDFVLPF